MEVLHRTHNVAGSFSISTEILANTASIAYTFLSAIVLIQRTVTCRLIGVEVSLAQEAGSTMMKHTEIAGISNTAIRVGAVIRTSIE